MNSMLNVKAAKSFLQLTPSHPSRSGGRFSTAAVRLRLIRNMDVVKISVARGMR